MPNIVGGKIKLKGDGCAAELTPVSREDGTNHKPVLLVEDSTSLCMRATEWQCHAILLQKPRTAKLAAQNSNGLFLDPGDVGAADV